MSVRAQTSAERKRWLQQKMPGHTRAECLCDEIDPADVPCMVCTCSESARIGPPPGAKVWPPRKADRAVGSSCRNAETNGGDDAPMGVGR